MPGLSSPARPTRLRGPECGFTPDHAIPTPSQAGGAFVQLSEARFRSFPHKKPLFRKKGQCPGDLGIPPRHGRDHSSRHGPDRRANERRRGRTSEPRFRGMPLGPTPVRLHHRTFSERVLAAATERTRERTRRAGAVHCGHATPPPRTWLRRRRGGRVASSYISAPTLGWAHPGPATPPPVLIGHSAALYEAVRCRLELVVS